MYIAAISGIDDELFQAAKVDGANRMQLIRHITIPSLIPTYFVLLMINRYLIFTYIIPQWEAEAIPYLLQLVC